MCVRRFLEGLVQKQMAHLFRTVHLHLKESGHTFVNIQVCVLAREDRWFEMGVKEAAHVKWEKPSLNRVDGLRHFLSPTDNTVLCSFCQKSDRSHRFMRPGDSLPCDLKLKLGH